MANKQNRPKHHGMRTDELQEEASPCAGFKSSSGTKNQTSSSHVVGQHHPKDLRRVQHDSRRMPRASPEVACPARHKGNYSPNSVTSPSGDPCSRDNKLPCVGRTSRKHREGRNKQPGLCHRSQRHTYQQSRFDMSNMDQIPPNMPGPKRKSVSRQNGQSPGRRVHTANYKTQTASRDSSSSGSASHVYQDEDNEDTSEIPGFYYDKVKKKYFKILPYQNNVNVITREVLMQKAAEELRQRNLAELQKETKHSKCQKKVVANRPLCASSHNMYDLVDGMRTHTKSWTSCPRFLRHLVSNLKPCGNKKIFRNSPGMDPYEKLEHMTKMVPNRDYQHLLCLWSLKGLIVQRIQMLKLNEMRTVGEDKSVCLDIQPTGSVVLQSFSKVTHVCWAPMSGDKDTPSSNILYTTTCFLGNNPSMAMLRRLDPNEPPPQSCRSALCTEFNLGCKATWTCAWNHHSLQFSIGSEKCGLLLDVTTRRLWELNTRQGDVFTQAFSHSTGQTLYSGTRRGLICVHDLRSMSSQSVSHMSHNASVCHLHLLQNDIYLLASDFSGRFTIRCYVWPCNLCRLGAQRSEDFHGTVIVEICQWDLRKHQVVNEYCGHSNHYHTLPFHVDPSETILYAAGQDCYSRLWDMSSGELLRSLPPPCPAALDNIPSLCLIPSPGFAYSLPGLLLGIQDKMHFYSS